MLRRYLQQSSPWLRAQLRCSFPTKKRYVSCPHQGKSRYSSHPLSAGARSGRAKEKKVGHTFRRPSLLDTASSSGPNPCISPENADCPCSDVAGKPERRVRYRRKSWPVRHSLGSKFEGLVTKSSMDMKPPLIS
ncbi:hypothetical protein CGRA01v4_05177 [Colletotrichum graminicola]|nr:hypothetical protein CGRA01v4_05177 [Colletotrichum graminicola]